MSQTPWYHDGLQFRCTRCGACCTGAPGTVRVSDEEIEALADPLELAPDTFREHYTRRLRSGDISLVEKPNHDCVFYSHSHGCTVHSQRPRQCRTWPFWGSVVRSRESWEEQAEDCPGMDQGHSFDAETITTLASEDGTSGST